MESAESEASEPASAPRLNASHWFLLAILAAVQLTHVLDFILVMPLATHLESDLGISTGQFGMVVSAYGFSAALAGLLLAPWLDRFDRKVALLLLYIGFTAGTLLCAVARSYEVLLIGRAAAGGFGGVVGALVLAIVGDAFPAERRGTAMGVVMSAFSVASVVGIPLGLMLAGASDLGWRAPFATLGAGSAVLLLVAWWVMPSVRGHLESTQARLSLWEVMSRPAHLRAFAFTLSLVMSSFVLGPYIAAFLEKNVGRSRAEIPWVYVCGGFATFLTMNTVGRLSDRFSKLGLFRILGLSVILPFMVVTTLPAGSSLAWVLTVTTGFMILTSARMVPAMALLTSCAAPRNRGSFLSVNASVQQLGLGLAPMLSVTLMGGDAQGQPLSNYHLAGLAGSLIAIVSVLLAGRVRPDTDEAISSEPPTQETHTPAEMDPSVAGAAP